MDIKKIKTHIKNIILIKKLFSCFSYHTTTQRNSSAPKTINFLKIAIFIFYFFLFESATTIK